MGTGANAFEGMAGRVAGSAMARLNRDMEHAAVDELDPAPDDAVLAVGFGPGVGITMLASRLTAGTVGGIDPSKTMVEQATRRNRMAVADGRVRLLAAEAASIPWPDGSFGAVVAVNSIQLWDPLAASVQETARVLTVGGVLVTLTHCWAIEKRAPVDEWVSRMAALLGGAGFAEITSRRRPFRSGDGLVLRARQRGGGQR